MFKGWHGPPRPVPELFFTKESTATSQSAGETGILTWMTSSTTVLKEAKVCSFTLTMVELNSSHIAMMVPTQSRTQSPRSPPSAVGGTLGELNFKYQKSGIPVTSTSILVTRTANQKLDIYSIPPESKLATTTADRGGRWLWVQDWFPCGLTGGEYYGENNIRKLTSLTAHTMR